MSKFFTIPFADKGDKKEVPLDDSSGFVSYEKGYTADYEKDPAKDKGKPIERDKLNQIFYDITANIKQWQEGTFPVWGAKNLDGSNYGYPKDSVVRHRAITYRSLIDNNTFEPTDTTKWTLFTSVSNDTPVGTILEYPSEKPPQGYAICDGATFDKDVYKELFNLLGSDRLPNLKGMVLKGLKVGQTPLEFEPQAVGAHTHTGTVLPSGAHSHGIGDMRIRGRCEQVAVSKDGKSTGCFRYDVSKVQRYMQSGGILTLDNYDLIYDLSSGWTGSMAIDGEHTHDITTKAMPSKDNLVDNVGVNFIIKLG